MNTLVPGLGPAYGFALLQGAVTLACTASALRQLPLSSARLHWTLAAGCLCLLALNSLVHADYALVLLMREAAQAGTSGVLGVGETVAYEVSVTIW